MRAVALLSTLTLLCASLVTACDRGEPALARSATASSAVPVEISQVRARDLSRRVSLSAPIEPLRLVELAAQTAGVVKTLHVEAGDRVEQGQLLAEIDVREARAELARARAQLRQQQVNLDRLRQLETRNYIDAASLSIAETELEVARAEVGLWETRVSFGSVHAPLSGVITAHYIEPGEAVGQYAPLLALADFDHLVVRFGLSELDVGELQVDDPVEISVDALADSAPLQARLRRILPATEGASRLVTVEVLLPDTARDQLRLGYLARTTLTVDRRSGVLAVPISSVGIRDGRSYVMVLDADARLQRRVVRTGITRGDWREIIDGLQPGEAVVRSNPSDFTEGEQVRVVGESPTA